MEGFQGGMTPEKGHEYAAEFNRIGEALHDVGLKLAYHNHHFEFARAGDGLTGYDVRRS